MSSWNFWIVLLGCLAVCHAAPTIAPTVSPEERDLAEEYLSLYYADVGTKNDSVRSIVRNVTQDLEAMQAFFGLEVTGVLDNETLEMMKAPRCGVSDISRYGHFAGKPKWQKRLITYRITRYTPDLRQSQVDATIAQAFQLYSDVIPLDFKQIYSGTADIMILFKGGLVAHEFGHALGLDHSRDRQALMFPAYQYVETNGYRLPDDDRRGVQALYGSRSTDATVKPKPPEPEFPTEDPNPDPLDPLPNPRNEQCSRDLVFDAATSIRGDLYYWQKSSSFREIRLIKVNTKWCLIHYVDAAFEVPNKDVVYLFEGTQYWGIRAYAKTIIPSYPKSLNNLGLPSSVKKVDAAVYIRTTGKTLIFVNKQYWSYDESRNRMDFGYPRSITQDFPGIGSKVDAAFENFGYLYFSSGPRQTEYDLQSKRVMRVLLNYGWLNCY